MDRHQRTALHYAASTGNSRFCAALLKRGCKLDARANIDKLCRTPVHAACLNGRVDIVKMFFAASSNSVWEPDYNGDTCLHIAARSGHLEVCRFLVEDANCPQKVLSSVLRIPKIWTSAFKIGSKESGEVFRYLKRTKSTLF